MFRWISAHRLPVILLTASVAIAAAGTTFLVLTLQPSESITALLPADRTVALWTTTERAEIDRSLREYPVLASLPALPSPFHVAVLELAPGAQAWIAMPAREEDATSFPSNLRIGGTAVLASTPDVGALLEGTDGRLASSLTFQALVEGTDAQTPRLYLRSLPAQPPAAGAVDRLLAALVPGAFDAALLGTEHGSRVLRLHRTDTPADAPRMTSPNAPALSPAPLLSVTLADPVDAWNRLLEPLAPANRSLADARAAQRVTDLVGEDVSLRFDLLPLLRRPATLHLSDTGPDTTLFLLDGTVDDARGLSDRLATFEQSALRSRRAGTVERRQFDDRFSAALIAADPSQVRVREEERDGWRVRMVENGSQTVFLTAERGERFLLSNTSVWMDQALRGDGTHTPDAFIGDRRDARAAGVVPARLLAPTNNPLLQAILPSVAPETPVAWEVREEGPVVSIAVQEGSR